MRAAVVVVSVLALSLGVVSQAQSPAAAPAPGAVGAPEPGWSPPRTPWGHPDLQGTYSNDDETGTPMQRPEELAGRTLADISPEELAQIVEARNEQFVNRVTADEFAGGLSPPPHLIFDSFERRNSRAWLIIDPPDGRIPPLTDEARTRPRSRGGVSTNANPRGPFNSWLDMGLYDRCITRGLPSSMMPAGYGSRYDITQSPDVVVIRYEMIREARVIPLDGRPRLPSSLQQYLGDARGWWDGDTLVVETTNFHPDTAPQGSSARVRMIERFTSTSADTVEWTATFDDPTTWTQPWTFSMPLTKVDDSQRMFEYACHEGNYAMRNILSAARAEERAAAEEGAGAPARRRQPE
jgi:hypothetical protein